MHDFFRVAVYGAHCGLSMAVKGPPSPRREHGQEAEPRTLAIYSICNVLFLG